MSNEKPITLELHPIEVDALIVAIVARVEDLEPYRDTVSVSESLVLLDIAKRIQKELQHEEATIRASH